MGISIRDVEVLAELTRLELTEEEKQLYAEQLGEILAYAAKLSELDTDHVEPTTHVLPLRNVMREDEVRPSWPIEQVLRNAPDHEDDQFKVPAVLD